MITKNNFTVDGALKITSLPVVSNTLSTLMEQDGNVVRRTLGTVSTLSKESYLPGFSVSLPSILNTNTNSIDYNSRELVISLANQMQGTAFLAPPNMNGTPAFRKIVKSDLNLASVIFDDDNRLHTHSNKSVLDGITSTKVSNWDTAFGWGEHNGKYMMLRNPTKGDINNVYNSGVGFWIDTTLNTPTNYGVILSLSNGFEPDTGGQGNWSNQLLFPTDNTNGDIYFRNKTNTRNWSTNIKLWNNKNLTKLSQLTNDINFDGDYVKKSGDTMTGDLFLNSNGIKVGNGNTNSIYNTVLKTGNYNKVVGGGGYFVVHTSNLGSALGRDLLLSKFAEDGQHSAGFWFNETGAFISKDLDERYKLATEKWVADQGYVKTDTKYTAGAGLTLSGNAFSLPVTQSGSGNYVSSVVQTTGGLTVTKNTLPIPALVTSTSSTGTTNVATTNTNTYLNIVSGGVATGSSTKITGAGSVTVASNTAGQLTITGTNTTYSTGTLQQLQTGTDTVGRLQTSKNLNDWFDSKYVPTTQVFEKTPQGGLKVKDWDGLANKLGAISIGPGAQATKINSLALVSGSSADGNSSIAIGLNAQSLAIRGISVAPNSTNNAPDSAIMGVGLLNNQKGCTVIGNYNNPIKQEVNVEVDETSPIFIIGNGKDSMLKSNSLEHFADGSTRYFGRQYYNRDARQESWFEDANTLVDVQYIRDNGAGLTPNPSSLAVYGFSGDILEGQSSYASKSGEFVYFDNNGIWQRVAIGGSSLNSQKHGVTFGIWLMDGRVLLRGYYRSDAPGSTQDRGKSYYYKAQNTNQAPQLVTPSSIGRDDIFLGTVITNTSVIFFNPR